MYLQSLQSTGNAYQTYSTPARIIQNTQYNNVSTSVASKDVFMTSSTLAEKKAAENEAKTSTIDAKEVETYLKKEVEARVPALNNLTFKAYNDNKVEIKGSYKALINIGFSLKGKLSVTKDGKLAFNVEDIKAAGIGMNGFKDKLMNELKKNVTDGVEVNGYSLLFTPEKLVSKDELMGKLKSVSTEYGKIKLSCE